MRDWATCGKEVAGVLPKGVGRSRALYHEIGFLPANLLYQGPDLR